MPPSDTDILTRPTPDPRSAPTVHTRLSAEERRALLVGMLTDPSLLAVARRHLGVTAFGSAMSSVEGVILTELYGHHDEHQTCPGYHVMMGRVGQHLTERRAFSGVSIITTEQVEAVLLPAYLSVGERDTAHCRQLLERLIADEETETLRLAHANIASVTVLGLRPDLEQVQGWYADAVAKVRAVNASPPQGLIPDDRAGFGSSANIPTGIPYIDRTLEDGAAQAGKTYGLLGPTGGGKTTLAVQILTSTARGLAERGEPGVCAYFAYEDYRTTALKALTQITGIGRSSLRRFLDPVNQRDLGALSTVGHLRPYEELHYERTQTPHAGRLGERKRWTRAVEMHARFAIYDKDDPDRAEAGRGGVAEIDADLTECTRRTGQPIKLVVVDYVHILADRVSGGQKSEKEGDLKKQIDRAMDGLKRLAKKYQCAVWIVQQMNADANRKPEGGGTHHSDSAGSTAFSHSTWACYTLGRSDSDRDNVRQLRQTKSRDTELAQAIVVGWEQWTGSLVEMDEYIVVRGRIAGEDEAAVSIQPTATVRSNAGQYD